jgi:hypothetical protein
MWVEEGCLVVIIMVGVGLCIMEWGIRNGTLWYISL